MFFVCVGTGFAAETRLTGSFSGVGTKECTNAPGFNSDYSATGPAWNVSGTLVFVYTFHPNGTGTAQIADTTSGILPYEGGVYAAYGTGSFSFTYTLNDGNITITVPSLTLQVTEGTGGSYTLTVTPGPTFVGAVSSDGNTITLTTSGLQVGTITPSTGGGGQSICLLTAILKR
jgi:hypothetical protein